MNLYFKRSECNQNSIYNYSKLLQEVFGNQNNFSSDYLSWLYKENPFGNVFGFDAFNEGELVAHYATVPVEYVLNSIAYKGLLSLNTATRKDFQGNGLFTKLSSKTIQAAKSEGYKFIIGVANENSTYGFIKKLGFKLIAPLETKVGVGLIDYKTDNHTFCQTNDKEYAEWRLKKPGTLYGLNRSKEIVMKKWRYLQIVMNSSIAYSKIKCINKGFLKLYIFCHPHYKKKGFFVSIPKILKPSPLNLIFLPLDNDLESIGKNDISFDCLNFDAY